MNTIDWWNQSTIKGAQNQSIESIKNSRGRYPSIDQAEKKKFEKTLERESIWVGGRE